MVSTFCVQSKKSFPVSKIVFKRKDIFFYVWVYKISQINFCLWSKIGVEVIYVSYMYLVLAWFIEKATFSTINLFWYLSQKTIEHFIIIGLFPDFVFCFISEAWDTPLCFSRRGPVCPYLLLVLLSQWDGAKTETTGSFRNITAERNRVSLSS